MLVDLNNNVVFVFTVEIMSKRIFFPTDFDPTKVFILSPDFITRSSCVAVPKSDARIWKKRC